MHIIAAVLLVAHGVAHLVGFRSAFWPEPRALKAGAPAVPSKVDGVLWLLVALAFIATAALLAAREEVWTTALVLSVVVSLVLCARSWPEARVGLAIDFVLLVLVLLLAPSRGNSYDFVSSSGRAESDPSSVPYLLASRVCTGCSYQPGAER